MWDSTADRRWGPRVQQWEEANSGQRVDSRQGRGISSGRGGGLDSGIHGVGGGGGQGGMAPSLMLVWPSPIAPQPFKARPVKN